MNSLQEKISEALHEAKDIHFPFASNLESYARGREDGLTRALFLVNSDIQGQQTYCASCGEFKHTPLCREEMGGYVCLTCIDKRLNEYLEKKQEYDFVLRRQ